MALSRSALASQQALIARLVASGATKGAIAEAAGVDACVVSKWNTDGTDPRAITLDEARRLADVYGWDVVMGPLATAAGWTVAQTSAVPAADPRLASIDLSLQVTTLARDVHAALADGRFDDREARELLHQIRESHRLLEALSARVGARS
jgi:hypothetical protein